MRLIQHVCSVEAQRYVFPCCAVYITHSAYTFDKCIQVQVGATPEGTETPKCIVDPTSIASIHSQPAEHRARIPQGADPKWRYMWRIGDRPAETRYAELNAEPVVPAGALLACLLTQCLVLPSMQNAIDAKGTRSCIAPSCCSVK